MSNSIRPKVISSAPAVAGGEAPEEGEFDLPTGSGDQASSTSAGSAQQVSAPVTSDVAEKTEDANKLIEKVGNSTRDPDKRKKLIDALDKDKAKRRPRRKRQAIERSVDKAGADLRDKTKVKLVKNGKTVRLRSKTGKIVTGRLNNGERSKVLVASDGSKVALINEKASRGEIAQEVEGIIQDTIVAAGRNFGLDLSGSVFEGLEDWFETEFGEFMARAIYVPTIALVHADLVSDQSRSDQLLEEQLYRRQQR